MRIPRSLTAAAVSLGLAGPALIGDALADNGRSGSSPDRFALASTAHDLDRVGVEYAAWRRYPYGGYRGRRVGWYHPGYRRAYYGYRPYYARPAYYGYRPYRYRYVRPYYARPAYYGYRPYGYRYNRPYGY
jgi:hypothetical protein